MSSPNQRRRKQIEEFSSQCEGITDHLSQCFKNQDHQGFSRIAESIKIRAKELNLPNLTQIAQEAEDVGKRLSRFQDDQTIQRCIQLIVDIAAEFDKIRSEISTGFANLPPFAPVPSNTHNTGNAMNDVEGDVKMELPQKPSAAAARGVNPDRVDTFSTPVPQTRTLKDTRDLIFRKQKAIQDEDEWERQFEREREREMKMRDEWERRRKLAEEQDSEDDLDNDDMDMEMKNRLQSPPSSSVPARPSATSPSSNQYSPSFTHRPLGPQQQLSPSSMNRNLMSVPVVTAVTQSPTNFGAFDNHQIGVVPATVPFTTVPAFVPSTQQPNVVRSPPNVSRSVPTTTTANVDMNSQQRSPPQANSLLSRNNSNNSSPSPAPPAVVPNSPTVIIDMNRAMDLMDDDKDFLYQELHTLVERAESLTDAVADAFKQDNHQKYAEKAGVIRYRANNLGLVALAAAATQAVQLGEFLARSPHSAEAEKRLLHIISIAEEFDRLRLWLEDDDKSQKMKKQKL